MTKMALHFLSCWLRKPCLPENLWYVFLINWRTGCAPISISNFLHLLLQTTKEASEQGSPSGSLPVDVQKTYDVYCRTGTKFQLPPTTLNGHLPEAGISFYHTLIKDYPHLVVPFTHKNLHDDEFALVAQQAIEFNLGPLLYRTPPDGYCHSFLHWQRLISTEFQLMVEEFFMTKSLDLEEERKAFRELIVRLSYTPASVLLPIDSYTEANEIHHAWAAANGFLGSKWKTDDENTKPASTSACMQMDQVSTPKICEQVVRRLLFQI
jgi:hypothetical protein